MKSALPSFASVRSRFSLSPALCSLALAIALPWPARAASLVSGCTDADLRVALAAGGMVTFSCDGTIVLTNTLTIALNTTLDATGHRVILSGSGSVRPLTVNEGVQFTLKGITVADGFAPLWGGGMLNHGSARLIDCTFSNNVASGSGAMGGAIYHRYGTLWLSGCLLVSNRAIASPLTFTFGGAIGGGSPGFFPQTPAGPFFATNCTFTGNSASNAAALSFVTAVGPHSPAAIVHSTIAGNLGGGVAYSQFGGTTNRLVAIHSIFADNAGNNGFGVTDGGHNLSSDASFGSHLFSVANIDPKLGQLADNGGPTLSMAPLPDSPAIDAGSPTGCAPVDQRGTPRPFGAACDIGAVEAAYAGTHPGVLKFVNPLLQVPEGSTVVTAGVVRAGGAVGSVTVDFATSNLLAVAGADFVGTNGTLSFAAGQRTNSFEVRLLDDDLVEGTENFLLHLLNPGTATLAPPSVMNVLLLDNDASVAWASTSLALGERASVIAATVIRSGNTSMVSTVNFATSNGSAGVGDYTPTSGTLTFGLGQTSALVVVAIQQDEYVEADESFYVTLSDPSDGTTLAGPATATLTIYDDDGVRVVSDCTDASLRLALGVGGRVHLDCDGTIVLTNSILVSRGAHLDANGRHVTVSGNNAWNVFTVNNGVEFTVEELTIAHGFSTLPGAGIRNNGTLNVLDCTFASNVVDASFAPNGTGGAIHNSGTLRVSGSTFRDNRTSYEGGAIASGFTMTPGPVLVTNSTFSGNTCSNGSIIAGGGTNPSYIVHCTLAGNVGRGISGTYTLLSSILAASSSTNCGGSVIDGGHNISSDGSCGFTHPASRNHTDPLLGPLADNGGPTFTLSLLNGSPATDTANAAASPLVDQRGFPRPYGIGADIGAFETTLIGTNPGSFEFEQTAVSRLESGAELTFTVHRRNGAFGAATVNFATADLSALAGTDYDATNGTLSFAAGEVQKSFAVRLLDDLAQEPDKMFTVSLSTPTGGTSLGTPAAATITIVDDETPAVVSTCDDASLRTAIATRPVVVLACDGVIGLTNTLVISGATTIDATGHDVRLSGGNAVRLFHIQSGATLTLQHLTLTEGLAVGAPGAPGQSGGAGNGGAVWNQGGILVATDCGFVRNKAMGGPGGAGGASFPPVTLPGPGGTGAGGAIYSVGGNHFLTNVVFDQNRAVGGRGGDIFPTSGQGGRSGTAQGGAIRVAGGMLRIHHGRFTGNGAAFGAPGVGFRIGSTEGVAGGGIYSTDTSIWVKDALFQDNGCGMRVDRPAGVFAGSASGGALWHQGNRLSMEQTAFLDNDARGGPTYQISSFAPPGGPGLGGALFINGDCTLTNCTLAGNLAMGGYYNGGFGPFSGSGMGGAIYNLAGLVLHNTTIANNAARGGEPAQLPGDGLGGGLFNAGGQVTLSHATVAGNSAQRSSTQAGGGNSLGGGLFSTNGSTTLSNSIVANSPSGGNGYGTFVDGGHNLSSDATLNLAGPGSLNNTDPRLGPLDDYGGPTPTMALLAGSPAFDTAGGASCPATDQRGVTRPFGEGCDIGAFESAPPYSVLGEVIGFANPAGGIQITTSSAATAVLPEGHFALHGLAAGTHVLSISSPEGVFVPTSRTVTVGPDQAGINFHSYRSNALTIEIGSGVNMHGVYAGPPNRTIQLHDSTNLPNWIPRSTNTTDAHGLFEFVDPAVGRRFYRVFLP